MSKTVLFQRIQFNINTKFISIVPIDRNLSGATIPSQTGTGSNSNEEAFPKAPALHGTSPSDCLESYPVIGEGVVLPLCREAVSIFYSPSQLDKSKVMLGTIDEGNLKSPISIATTLMCRRGCNSFPRIALLYPWYILYNTEHQGRRYQVPFFESLVWLNLVLNPGLLGHWWTHCPLDQRILTYTQIY